MAVRTRHFDRLFTDAAAAGVRQAVILAAGLDARAYRLPWPDGTTVYEVDQPEVIDVQEPDARRAGRQAQGRPAHHRRSTFVMTGRKHCWTTASTRAQPTAWTAEGLLIYLPSRPKTCCSTGSRAQRPRQQGRDRAHPGRQHVLRRAVETDLGTAQAIRPRHRDVATSFTTANAAMSSSTSPATAGTCRHSRCGRHTPPTDSNSPRTEPSASSPISAM